MNNDKNTQLDPLENLKKELIKLYENTDDTILSVGYGCKSINDIYSEEKCISFGVVKKLPENEISSEKIIPKTITVDGIVYKTDVYETEIPTLTYNMEYTTSDQSCVAYKLVIDDDNPSVTDIHIRELRGLCGNRKALFYNPNNPNNEPDYIYIPNGAIFCFDSNAPQNFPSQFSGYATDNIPYHFERKSTEPSNCTVTYCCNECCQGCEGFIFDSEDSIIPESTYHKNVVRPLKGGVSIIEYVNENNSNVIASKTTSGTLGGVVIDSRDGKMIGITNAHVAGTAAFRKNSGYVYKNDWIENLLLHVSDQVFNDGALINTKIGAYYDAYRQNDVVQPSFKDGEYNINIPPETYISLNGIGTTKRVYPMRYDDYNEIDCALINLNNSIVSTDSWKQLGLTALTTPSPFATTEEINNITINTPVMLSGRTSGIRGASIYNKVEQDNINNYYSYVSIKTISNINEPKSVYVKNESGPAECLIQVISTSTVTAIGSGIEVTPMYQYAYKNLIKFKRAYPNLTAPLIGGDSGSLLYAFINNQWKIIGLNFAGNNVEAFACRIDRVAELMNIEPYLGTSVDATPNTPKDRALPYEVYKSQRSTTISGKKYWLVGRAQLFPTDDAFELKPE